MAVRVVPNGTLAYREFFFLPKTFPFNNFLSFVDQKSPREKKIKKLKKENGKFLLSLLRLRGPGEHRDRREMGSIREVGGAWFPLLQPLRRSIPHRRSFHQNFLPRRPCRDQNQGSFFLDKCLVVRKIGVKSLSQRNEIEIISNLFSIESGLKLRVCVSG